VDEGRDDSDRSGRHVPYSTPTLSGLVTTHQLDVAGLATHHLPLDRFMAACEVLANASEAECPRSFSHDLHRRDLSSTDEPLDARSER
jgi:hypothetical protein